MASRLTRFISLMALALVAAWAAPLRAKPAPAPAKASPTPAPALSAPAEGGQGAEAAGDDDPGPSPWREGPTPLDLGHDLTLDLPAGYRFLGLPLAAELMKRMGNLHNESLLGLVTTSNEEDDSWFVVVRYDDVGYIKDDEEVDAGELLDAIKEGTEQDNEERAKQGFKPLKVGGWAEAPHYDRSKHHLVWALTAESEEGASVNYNTRVLGRRGYVALNLVTDPGVLAAHKPEAARLLSATHFKPGARYEDFDSKGGDKVAEYGLAGLVLGGAGLGAAKLVKLGLMAKFWNVIVGALIAGKKLIVFAAIAVVAFVKRLFGRKSEPAA